MLRHLRQGSNKDNADNVKLITFPCDNDECQTLEELEAQKNSHLVEFETEEADSCLPCKRRFNYPDDLMITSRGTTRPALRASSTE